MLLAKAFSSGTLPKQHVYVHGEDEFLDAEEAWLHDEASEEGGQACSDAELIASQRRIIIDIGKQLGRKIMAGNLNLINITLPVVMFEPRSYLQKLADPWVHPVHLEAAAATSCPVERLKLCVAWFVAGLQHVFSSWRKPFNPVLGETWQAYLPTGSTICCEQISHHPPVTAFHMEGPCSVFSFDGLSQPEVSFNAGGLRTSARGYRRITFASDGAVIAITYPYYRIGGLLSGVPHGLIKGTATLTDTKHSLTATVTFGPVGRATSRLLSRADSFEVVITVPAAAATAVASAGIIDDVNNVIAVPAWVKQAVAEVAAGRAGCCQAAGMTASPAAPVLPVITQQMTAVAAAAAAVTGGADASAGVVYVQHQQRKEVEESLGQSDCALTSSNSNPQWACQETARAAAAAAATKAGLVNSEGSLHASLLSGMMAKQIDLPRSKSDSRTFYATTHRAATLVCKQQQQGYINSSKDGHAGSSSSSKDGRRLAQFFVRASSTALRISSSSSTTCNSKCSSNSSSTQSLANLDNSSSTGKSSRGSKSLLKNFIQSTSGNSSSTGSAERSSSRRFYQFFGPVACFMSPDADSRDISEHNGSSIASSRRSSRGPEEGYCITTAETVGAVQGDAMGCRPMLADHQEIAAAAAAATEGGTASSFKAVGLSCGGSSSRDVQHDLTISDAAADAKDADAAITWSTARNANIAVAAEYLSGTSPHSSSSNNSRPSMVSPMQPPPLQQQQRREQVAAVSPVRRSSHSVTRKQQQQQHTQRNEISGVQVLAIGSGCWLSHLDFDGQRYWTLVDDTPEVWQSQQQQQYVLPSDCQNRLDLVALRQGDVKLSQQLKEQMEQQQRRDAKARPSFPHADCSA